MYLPVAPHTRIVNCLDEETGNWNNSHGISILQFPREVQIGQQNVATAFENSVLLQTS